MPSTLLQQHRWLDRFGALLLLFGVVAPWLGQIAINIWLLRYGWLILPHPRMWCTVPIALTSLYCGVRAEQLKRQHYRNLGRCLPRQLDYWPSTRITGYLTIALLSLEYVKLISVPVPAWHIPLTRLLAATALVTVAIAMWKYFEGNRRLKHTLCCYCGYDVRGLSRCAECGHAAGQTTPSERSTDATDRAPEPDARPTRDRDTPA